jgi:hypothetical protein
MKVSATLEHVNAKEIGGPYENIAPKWLRDSIR